MALPIYTNDLTTIATGDITYDVDTLGGVWDESTDGGWDTGGAMVDDENLWYTENILNTGEALNSCTSAQYTKDGIGSGATGPGTIMFVNVSAFTVPTDGVVLMHHLWAAPTSLNIYEGTANTAEAGISVLVGDSLGVFDVFYTSGSNKSPAPEGGWYTYAVDPTLTPDNSVGTPTTTTMVGAAVAAVAQARGNPNAIQAIRYGRAEVEYTAGDATTPATFDGYALIDNAPKDRFNLLQMIPGGYQLRGLSTFGTAATAVYFQDSDKSIVVADDPKVGTSFNKAIVNNAASTLIWTNIAITNLGLVAKYSFQVNDSATTSHIGCVFTDLGTFSYGTNSTQTNTTFRRQEPISQLSSTFTSCTFDKPVTTGLISNNLNLVTKSTFSSAGTGYGIDLGNITTDTTYIWDNFENGYVSGSTGSDVGLTPSGSETILANVSAGITLTINIATGASIPSIADSGTGIVAVIAGQVDFTFTISPAYTNYEYRIYSVDNLGSLAGSVELQGLEAATLDTYTYTYTYSAATPIAVQLIPHLNDFESPNSLSTSSDAHTQRVRESACTLMASGAGVEPSATDRDYPGPGSCSDGN